MDEPADSDRHIAILIDSKVACTNFPLDIVKRIPEPERSRRVDFSNSAILLTPLGPGDSLEAPVRPRGRTELKVLLTAKVDMAIPKWLLNLAIDTMSCLVLWYACGQVARLHE